MSIQSALREHITSDHFRGCQGREYSCDCGYDTKTKRLLKIAAARIEALEKRVEALETALRVIIDEPDGCVSPSFKALAATALGPEQDK